MRREAQAVAGVLYGHIELGTMFQLYPQLLMSSEIEYFEFSTPATVWASPSNVRAADPNIVWGDLLF